MQIALVRQDHVLRNGSIWRQTRSKSFHEVEHHVVLHDSMRTRRFFQTSAASSSTSWPLSTTARGGVRRSCLRPPEALKEREVNRRCVASRRPLATSRTNRRVQTSAPRCERSRVAVRY